MELFLSVESIRQQPGANSAEGGRRIADAGAKPQQLGMQRAPRRNRSALRTHLEETCRVHDATVAEGVRTVQARAAAGGRTQPSPRKASSFSASAGAALFTSLSKKHHTSRPSLRHFRMLFAHFLSATAE